MTEKRLIVTVVYDSQGQECDARCGLDWSTVEVVETANLRIREKFGERVKLEVIDLSAAEPHRLRLKKTDNVALPWLLMEGGLRISGPFDLRQLTDAIEAESEIRRK